MISIQYFFPYCHILGCTAGTVASGTPRLGSVHKAEVQYTRLRFSTQGLPLLPVNQTGTSDSVQAQDRPQPPQLSPVFQTLHWLYRVVPLRYWQSDDRTSAAVLPYLRATQKGNLARPHSRSPQALQKPEGPAMHYHLHWGDWSFHLTNEKKKKVHYFVCCMRFRGSVKVNIPSHTLSAVLHSSGLLVTNIHQNSYLSKKTDFLQYVKASDRHMQGIRHAGHSQCINTHSYRKNFTRSTCSSFVQDFLLQYILMEKNISPKQVNPRDTAGNVEEEEEIVFFVMCVLAINHLYHDTKGPYCLCRNASNRW